MNRNTPHRVAPRSRALLKALLVLVLSAGLGLHFTHPQPVSAEGQPPTIAAAQKSGAGHAAVARSAPLLEVAPPPLKDPLVPVVRALFGTLLTAGPIARAPRSLAKNTGLRQIGFRRHIPRLSADDPPWRVRTVFN